MWYIEKREYCPKELQMLRPFERSDGAFLLSRVSGAIFVTLKDAEACAQRLTDEKREPGVWYETVWEQED